MIKHFGNSNDSCTQHWNYNLCRYNVILNVVKNSNFVLYIF